MNPIGNRVLLVLVLAGLAAAVGLAFLTSAPNRLVMGTGIGLCALLDARAAWLALPAGVLFAGVFVPQRPRTHAVTAVAATMLLAGLVWLAGTSAARLAPSLPAAGRISLGGGFWVLVLVTWLAAGDALQRLRLRTATNIGAHALVLAPIVILLATGALDRLSLLHEYATRESVFWTAVRRHVEIVLATLVPIVLIGVPVGLFAFHRTRWRTSLLNALNIIQTTPSIALFGLLMVPLALLATEVPVLRRIGISGIGLAPAIIALVLYGLLPVVRSTIAGLSQVPNAAVDAATGLGFTPRQIFWRVQLPLALPVFLAGVRIATVQTVGLVVVAALIGAGGLGALVFQGLASSALDLVLLGVIPVVALAIAVDAVFRLAANGLAPASSG